MTDADDLTADELDQLAQSLAVDGSLGGADTLRVVAALRELGPRQTTLALLWGAHEPALYVGDAFLGHRGSLASGLNGVGDVMT